MCDSNAMPQVFPIMKRRRRLRPVPAALALLVLTVAGCGARGPAFDAGAGAAAVRGVLEAQRTAWNRGDLDGFLEGYWKSDLLTFYSGSDVSRGWEATRARYVRTYPSEGREMGTLEFDLHDVAVVAPDRATVSGAWRLTRSKDAPHGTFTLLLRRFPDAGWKIVEDRTTSAAE
jgi:beta-aspartyl-peptidase (threonine type)